MSSVVLVLLPATLTILYIVLLIVERKSGHRYGARMRRVFDQSIDEVKRAFVAHTPDVNHQFFRQLFHYVIHLCLSFILWVLNLLERGLRRIARLNRTKAVTSASVAPDSHLRKIAEHKEESALTEKEKKARKKAALRGDS